MSNSSPRRVGGEYGALRANIDIDKLNAYLVAHVPAVSSPVDVQQFKVRSRLSRVTRPVSDVLSSLDRYCLVSFIRRSIEPQPNF